MLRTFFIRREGIKERSKRSMKDLVHIRKTDISVKEHKGQLVAIFRKIDMVYMIDQTEETLNQRKKFNRGDTRGRKVFYSYLLEPSS